MNTKEDMQILFSENLGREHVDENENIFDLGGNSLMIYRICQQAKERFRIQIKPIELMMYPSINKIAEQLDRPPEADGAAGSDDSGRNAVRRRRRRNDR